MGNSLRLCERVSVHVPPEQHRGEERANRGLDALTQTQALRRNSQAQGFVCVYYPFRLGFLLAIPPFTLPGLLSLLTLSTAKLVRLDAGIGGQLLPRHFLTLLPFSLTRRALCQLHLRECDHLRAVRPLVCDLP
jgi:hypothetical protein